MATAYLLGDGSKFSEKLLKEALRVALFGVERILHMVVANQNTYVAIGRIAYMQRRQLLGGIATGLPLLAGCMSLLGSESVIDASNLSKYTSDKYGYSVKYPSEWSKSASGSATVQFKPESNDGIMLTQCVPGAVISLTRDEYMDKIIQAYKTNSEEFSTSNEQTIELPNGYTGKAITMTATIKSNEDLGTAKGRTIFASNKEKIYDAMVFVKEDKYEATKPAMDEIIKSLTIEK